MMVMSGLTITLFAIISSLSWKEAKVVSDVAKDGSLISPLLLGVFIVGIIGIFVVMIVKNIDREN